MLTYKGKELTKVEDKKGGKNQGKVDGFYRDPDGLEFFVKKPKDLKELFTELFAGLLLQEFMRRKLIDPIYHASLICAELIQFDDGSYGLIQPKVSFNELYKIIGTGYRDGSDRDPLWEMFCGPQFYLSLTQLRQYYGLAIALMFSLLLGDNSVHSGNVVCLDVVSAVEMLFIQFARIDWGAAFRYFGHKKNNEDLLYPFEYQGWFNLKGYTKGYFLNYLKIKGLFPTIAQQARIFQQKVNETLLVDMISTVLRKLPADLVDSKTKIELANYLCMESFNDISFGEGGNYQQFACDLTGILQDRLKKITVMQDSSAASAQSDLSQITYVESLPTAIALPVNMITPFAEQMNAWLYILFSSDEKSVFDFNSIDRPQLAQQFNSFLDGLLRQVERLKSSADEACFIVPNESITLPYSESNFLRCLFTLTTDLTPHLPSYKENRVPYQQAYWQIAEKVLESGFQAMVTIRVLQNTQNSTEIAKASAIHFLFDALKEYLKVFSDMYPIFLQELEKKLSSMPGVQLARICLNEMEFMNSSSLIGIILKSPILWSLMNKAFEEEDEMLYSENAAAIIQLRQFHEDFNLFLILVRELELISQIETKGGLVKEISRIFANLPQFLQTELATPLNKVQAEFRELHRRHSIELEKKQGKDDSNLSAEKGNTVASHKDSSESTQLSKQKFSSEIGIEDTKRHTNGLFFFSLPESTKFLSPTNESLAQKEALSSVIAS
ncbi:LepB GTPase-activating domain-containing protein [Legionella maioricensis]|uniref:LepB GTPase-activating domain-containing protein n=1 Tax=Legionella maioricensis TaxID=2896528 RepID=A0A9X2CZY8_9GAMM|nr:LepB GTPase-activating domain-containing protein [Legionella maioricensis]MCL9683878.1 LepB GTPase-activating domain-containing protein [Legionella maioricensis]MCL9686725.1 LepB GTPase-activating domain-containing protein [Legionella maioricensis]